MLTTQKCKLQQLHEKERRHQLIEERVRVHHGVALLSDCGENVKNLGCDVVVVLKSVETVDAVLKDFRTQVVIVCEHY